MQSLLKAVQEGKLFELPAAEKTPALTYLAGQMDASSGPKMSEELAARVLQHERVVTSGVGFGVACPHTRSAGQGDLRCVVGWSSQGLSYGSPDGIPVRLLVMYLIPENQTNTYLKEISVLIAALQKAGGIPSMAKAKDIATLRAALLEWVTAALNSGTPTVQVRTIQMDPRGKTEVPAGGSWVETSVGGGLHRSLDRKLVELREKVGELGSVVSSLVALDLKLLNEDAQVDVSEMSKFEAQVEGLEDEIDTLTLNILALYQPVASDIRFLYAIPKITNALARAAGQAFLLADELPGYRKKVRDGLAGACSAGIEQSEEMLRGALEAFTSKSGTLAVQVFQSELQVESYCAGLFQQLVSYLSFHSKGIPEAFDWSLIPHRIERIAHYARTVAEEVLFWTEGQKLRHHHDHYRKPQVRKEAAGR